MDNINLEEKSADREQEERDLVKTGQNQKSNTSFIKKKVSVI